MEPLPVEVERKQICLCARASPALEHGHGRDDDGMLSNRLHELGQAPHGAHVVLKVVHFAKSRELRVPLRVEIRARRNDNDSATPIHVTHRGGNAERLVRLAHAHLVREDDTRALFQHIERAENRVLLPLHIRCRDPVLLGTSTEVEEFAKPCPRTWRSCRRGSVEGENSLRPRTRPGVDCYRGQVALNARTKSRKHLSLRFPVFGCRELNLRQRAKQLRTVEPHLLCRKRCLHTRASSMHDHAAPTPSEPSKRSRKALDGKAGVLQVFGDGPPGAKHVGGAKAFAEEGPQLVVSRTGTTLALRSGPPARCRCAEPAA